MIAHVVLFQPGASVGAETQGRDPASLDARDRQCPTVRACRIGRRIRHGLPGYEQPMREDYQYAAGARVRRSGGAAAYLEHPAHGAIGRLLHERRGGVARLRL